MKELPADKGLKVFDIRWEITTAGPSPYNNKRTELFLLGCKKAAQGNPCKGCFNSSLWDSSIAEFSWNPEEVANRINDLAPNKYITIGGGEPTDQIDNLIILCKCLKKYGFHIMIYTWRDLERILRNHPPYVFPTDFDFSISISRSKIRHLLKYLDIVIDGQFDVNEVLYDSSVCDGFLNSIGSGNQKIWNIKTMEYKSMRDLKGIKLDRDNNLIYELK